MRVMGWQAAQNVIDEVEQTECTTGFGRINKKLQFMKNYKGPEDVEDHALLCPEETRYINEKYQFSL